MKYKGARIQVLDLPGIIEGAAEGKGRGRQVISTARTCNMILIVLDAGKPVTHKKIIEQELFSFGIQRIKSIEFGANPSDSPTLVFPCAPSSSTSNAFPRPT